MSEFHGEIYFLEVFGVLRLRVSIRALIRCIRKVSESYSFGIGWLDVEEVFKSLHQFVEYKLATVPAILLLFQEFGFLAAITARFSRFLQRTCRCPARPQLQHKRYWADPGNSFFATLLAYFGTAENTVGSDPDEFEGPALLLFALLANTSSCICTALASSVCSSRKWVSFPMLYRCCPARSFVSGA